MFDYFQMSNIIGSVIVPGAQHTINNPTTAYFAKYLLEKAVSIYKWELPKTWDKDYFLYVLYVAGFVGVINAGPKYGIVPQWVPLTDIICITPRINSAILTRSLAAAV